MSLHITTPFGRRSLTAAQIRAQANADGCPHEITVNKWAVMRDLSVARERLTLSPQTLFVLDALLSFHPETTLTRGEGAELVVFPSNAALGVRARGISESTLRRHLRALVEAGIVIRRDSPNGKRYARRQAGAAVRQAYGFDLTPLIARASEFAALADEIRAEALALRVARERLTLLRRDCAKLILALEEREGASGKAAHFRGRYAALVGGLARPADRMEIEAVAATLEGLAADVSKCLLANEKESKMDGNAAQNERHKHNSNPEPTVYEPATEKAQKASVEPHPTIDGQSVLGVPTRSVYPLGLVLDSCPDICDYARQGIRTWGDLIDVAGFVRTMLGISPHAWDEAKTVMGEDTAAVTVAAILQRAEHIKSPGGYLRSLVERKRAGQYSLGPVLQALNRARLQELRS